MARFDPTSSDSATAAAPPFPPRYWWLKRLSLVAVALGAVLGALYAHWWFEAERRLSLRLAEYRARGEPIYAEDFGKPMPAEADNAAPLLVVIESQIESRGDRRGAHRYGELASAWLENPYVLADDVGEGEPLPFLRQLRADFACAMRLPACDWGYRLESPILGQNLPSAASLRSTSRAFNALARYEAELGRHEEALTITVDLLALAARMQVLPNVLFDLIQSAHEAVVFSTLVEIVSTTAPDSPGVRCLLHEVLATLNEEAHRREVAVVAHYGERAQLIDAYVIDPTVGRSPTISDWLTEPGAFITHAGSPIHRPLRALDLPLALDQCDQVREALLAEDGAAAAGVPPTPPTYVGIDKFVHVYSSMLLGSTARSAVVFHNTMAKRRRAARVVAEKLFEWERGRVPESPLELVPDYLPRLYDDAL